MANRAAGLVWYLVPEGLAFAAPPLPSSMSSGRSSVRFNVGTSHSVLHLRKILWMRAWCLTMILKWSGSLPALLYLLLVKKVRYLSKVLGVSQLASVLVFPEKIALRDLIILRRSMVVVDLREHSWRIW
jgi:hypothetical protein